MKIVARWSIVAGVLGVLAMGIGCGESSNPHPQGLNGTGAPEGDAGVKDDDAGDDVDKGDGEAPSIVDSGDPPKTDGGDTPDPSDADPPDPGPQLSECASCVEANCQDERTACRADETCACWADCSETGGFAECIKDCSAPNQATLSYQQCRDRNCMSDCSPRPEPEFPDGGLFPDGGFSLDGGSPFDSGSADNRSCDECVADSCATASAACNGNSNCACWAGCFTGNNWVDCTQQCGSGSQGWFDVLGCRMSSCPQCR